MEVGRRGEREWGTEKERKREKEKKEKREAEAAASFLAFSSSRAVFTL